MLLFIGVIVLSFLLALNWHKVPFWNFLKRDLSTTWLKLGNRQFRLSGLKPNSTQIKPLDNFHFVHIEQRYDLYDTYDSKNKSFLYKAFAKEKKIFFYRFYIIESSSIEEIV